MTHSLEFSDLVKGQSFARLSLSVTHDEVEAYLESIGERVDAWREFVPPVYLDAFAIATLLATVAIPKGVMHTGQEHECHRAARIGETLELEMHVSALSDRKGATIAGFEAEVTGADAEPVMSMKISVMVLPDGVTA